MYPIILVFGYSFSLPTCHGIGSPNSSLSSSQSVEDLSSLRRGRTRQRRSASSSSDSSPDTRPASHTHAHSRRPHAHPPRTNPHCSPRVMKIPKTM